MTVSREFNLHIIEVSEGDKKGNEEEKIFEENNGWNFSNLKAVNTPKSLKCYETNFCFDYGGLKMATMFCHCLHQEVGLISPPHESRLALWPTECGWSDTTWFTFSTTNNKLYYPAYPPWALTSLYTKGSPVAKFFFLRSCSSLEKPMF